MKASSRDSADLQHPEYHLTAESHPRTHREPKLPPQVHDARRDLAELVSTCDFPPVKREIYSTCDLSRFLYSEDDSDQQNRTDIQSSGGLYNDPFSPRTGMYQRN